MYSLETEKNKYGQSSVCVQFSSAAYLGHQKRMMQFLLIFEVLIGNSLPT